ncbi:hypothetical protein B0G80_4070 [Paraburkholderia sp. BL6669N2]|nr:hypothetical protein B0G80_4070 [Paraburkholderia sp. BL6669N2]
MHGLCTLLRNLAVSDEAASQNLVVNIRSRVNPQKGSPPSAMVWEFEKHRAARDPIALVVQPLWIQMLDQSTTWPCDNDGVKESLYKPASLPLP